MTKSKEELLDEAAALVLEANKDEVFTKFLDAFMDAEAEHINASLSDSGNLNLRTAALCAEAYAAASLMKKVILGEADDMQ